MNQMSSIRYFFLASPPRRYVTFVQALAALGGVASGFLDAMDTGFVLLTILFLQMFACSTGYVTHGSRGHYDPVLAMGRPRWRVGLAHFLASALPGFAAWVGFGAYAAITGGSKGTLAFRPASLVFFWLVSAIAWLITLRLPPLSGGVLWSIAVLVTAISSGGLRFLAATMDSRESLLERPTESIVGGLLLAPLIFAAPWPPLHIAAFALVSLIALGLGLLFISRRDLPLAEEE